MNHKQEQPLGSLIFHKLRDDILDRKYKEGDELKEVSLGTELGVSRTPVREALRQLELEGLVKIVPNKGAIVIGINERDVEEIYQMRYLLEGLCARWSIDNITERELADLEECVMLSEYYLKRDDAHSEEQMSYHDERFHEILYQASHSRILGKLLQDFHNYVRYYRKQSILSGERARRSIREHKQLLRAIQDGDKELAEQLAKEHMLQVMEAMR